MIKPQPRNIKHFDDGEIYAHCDEFGDESRWMKCPYGKVGDLLWVRETWSEGYKKDLETREKIYHYNYKADYFDKSLDGVFITYSENANRNKFKTMADLHKWKPSIFMPRAASRITLEITDIRVERLQDISGEDAIAEGAVCSGDPDEEMGRGNVPKWSMTGDTDWRHCLDLPQYAFCNMWNKINGKKHSWESNPWVWVIEFKKL